MTLPGARQQLGLTLALGQAISFLVAATGVCSGLLAQRGISIPTSQSTLNYYLLAACYGGYRVFQSSRKGDGVTVLQSAREGLSPSVPWWRYALLALCDVEANYLVVKAYSYTSVTSIMLIDCWSIVVAMGLSWWFLGRNFHWRHGLGVALCVLGLGVLAASDAGLDTAAPATSSGAENATLVGGMSSAASSHGTLFGAVQRVLSPGHDRPVEPWASAAAVAPAALGTPAAGPPSALIGDLLCLAAATLYGVSNVGQEAVVKTHGRTEFLALLGIWGSAFNTAQLLALERAELASALGGAGGGDTGVVVGLVLGFAACLFAMYTLTSVFLARCDATLFNLSLLTSDAWAILASLLIFGAPLHPLYWPALLLIAAGLVVYNRAPSPVAGRDAPMLLDEDEQGSGSDSAQSLSTAEGGSARDEPSTSTAAAAAAVVA